MSAICVVCGAVKSCTCQLIERKYCSQTCKDADNSDNSVQGLSGSQRTIGGAGQKDFHSNKKEMEYSVI